MKKYLLFVTIIFCLYSIAEESSDFSEKRKIEYIKNQISLILPEGSSILSIEKSEFPGIYKVFYGDIQPIYVSEEGSYFIYGNMFKIRHHIYFRNAKISIPNLNRLELYLAP